MDTARGTKFAIRHFQRHALHAGNNTECVTVAEMHGTEGARACSSLLAALITITMVLLTLSSLSLLHTHTILRTLHKVHASLTHTEAFPPSTTDTREQIMYVCSCIITHPNNISIHTYLRTGTQLYIATPLFCCL